MHNTVLFVEVHPTLLHVERVQHNLQQGMVRILCMNRMRQWPLLWWLGMKHHAFDDAFENEKRDDCFLVYLEVLCVCAPNRFLYLRLIEETKCCWFGCHVDFTCFMLIFNATCAKRLEIIDDVMHKFWACKANVQHHCNNAKCKLFTHARKCKKPLMHSC